MTRLSSLLSITALAIGLSAGAASAETEAASMKVSLSGKTSTQISAEIHQAAKTVCLRELTGTVAMPYGLASCVKAASTQALAAAEKILSAQAARPELVASAAITR